MSIWIIPSLLTILPFVSLMQSCVTDLGNVAVRLKEVVDFGFSQLGSSAIKPRLKPLTDVFLSTSHNISEVRSISQHLRGKIYLTTSQRLDLSHNISELRSISQYIRGKIYVTTSHRYDISCHISEVWYISQHIRKYFYSTVFQRYCVSHILHLKQQKLLKVYIYHINCLICCCSIQCFLVVFFIVGWFF